MFPVACGINKLWVFLFSFLFFPCKLHQNFFFVDDRCKSEATREEPHGRKGGKWNFVMDFGTFRILT